MKKSSYAIAVLPGDGIGPEVMRAALEVLHALAPRIGRRFNTVTHPAGAEHYLASGVALPDATLDACRAADAILFGAMGLPHVRGADGTEIVPQLDLRFALDLYAGVRPVRSFAGLPGPLADARAAHIDLVLVRESTEGLFHARGRGRFEGRGDDAAALDTMKITHRGSRPHLRLRAAAAERGAQNKPGRVTNVDKASIFTSMAFWRRFDERAAAFPTCPRACLRGCDGVEPVMKPWAYAAGHREHVRRHPVRPDRRAGRRHGHGTSADIGDHARCSSRRTAPRPTSPARVWPTQRHAAVLTMMLDWLAERDGDAALADGARHQPRWPAPLPAARCARASWGPSGTGDIVRAVLDRL